MEKSKGSAFIKEITKGVCTTVIVVLLSVLIFAFIVKFSYLGNGVIKAVNQFIKVISVFLGCTFGIKNGLGLIKGALIGGISCLITSLVFSLCQVGLGLNVGFIIDLIFTAVIGGICGIIVVNVKKKQ